MSSLAPHERIVLPLDVATGDQAVALAEQLAGEVGAMKVGLELFNAEGPSIFPRLAATGAKIFYDAKLLDIPNTVAGAILTAGRHDLWMINLHATGGAAMMTAAVSAVGELDHRPLLIGVTVLTSIDSRALNEELGVPYSPADQAVRLAEMTQSCGLDGVVASPLEAAAIREACGSDFLIVTPGVRPAWAAANDQRRFTTPAQAVANGSDYLVIGRPITRAEDPVAAARRIAEELS